MIKLVRRNLLRNKRRTFLTVASLAMAVFILALLGVLLDAMDFADDSSVPDRLVVRHAISLTFPLPEAYEARLRTIEGVEEVTPQSWFQGVYRDERPENAFPRFTIDPATFRAVFYDWEFDEDEWQAFASRRTAFAAGRALAEAQGWEIGDSITIQGDVWPVDVQLELRAIFDAESEGEERQIFFHRRYVEQALGNPGQVGTYWMKLDDPEAAPAVVAAAEAMFENSDNQVRAETAEAFVASFSQMFGNIRMFFGAIGLAIAVSIFLITANHDGDGGPRTHDGSLRTPNARFRPGAGDRHGDGRIADRRRARSRARHGARRGRHWRRRGGRWNRWASRSAASAPAAWN